MDQALAKPGNAAWTIWTCWLCEMWISLSGTSFFRVGKAARIDSHTLPAVNVRDSTFSMSAFSTWYGAIPGSHDGFVASRQPELRAATLMEFMTVVRRSGVIVPSTWVSISEPRAVMWIALMAGMHRKKASMCSAIDRSLYNESLSISSVFDKVGGGVALLLWCIRVPRIVLRYCNKIVDMCLKYMWHA